MRIEAGSDPGDGWAEERHHAPYTCKPANCGKVAPMRLKVGRGVGCWTAFRSHRERHGQWKGMRPGMPQHQDYTGLVAQLHQFRPDTARSQDSYANPEVVYPERAAVRTFDLNQLGQRIRPRGWIPWGVPVEHVYAPCQNPRMGSPAPTYPGIRRANAPASKGCSIRLGVQDKVQAHYHCKSRVPMVIRPVLCEASR
jgi:hypothetical protein